MEVNTSICGMMILRRLGSSEHFAGKFGSGGAKNPLSFSSFFSRNMLGLKSVSLTLVCLFLCRIALLLMHNLITSWFEPFPFSQEFRPPLS